mmetsp:Transcript_26093/g.78637  ORF Transcript_26093/g.78637 Transcript_26093/m.78637 type:complete len:262 (+) Transcript_26093:373-1158(+)
MHGYGLHRNLHGDGLHRHLLHGHGLHRHMLHGYGLHGHLLHGHVRHSHGALHGHRRHGRLCLALLQLGREAESEHNLQTGPAPHLLHVQLTVDLHLVMQRSVSDHAARRAIPRQGAVRRVGFQLRIHRDVRRYLHHGTSLHGLSTHCVSPHRVEGHLGEFRDLHDELLDGVELGQPARQIACRSQLHGELGDRKAVHAIAEGGESGLHPWRGLNENLALLLRKLAANATDAADAACHERGHASHHTHWHSGHAARNMRHRA